MSDASSPSLQIYNTLTNEIETFQALDPRQETVTFYTCGPTVYDYAHIGNFRSFLNADILRRTLEHLGFTVKQVMNMTDVGHMTEDDVADGGGEDKMEAAAKRLKEAKKSGALPEGVSIDAADPYAIADFYAGAFIDDARRLGVKVVLDAADDPSLMPRPTRYVQPMIDMIQTLIDRDHAYVASDGVVYFDVQSFPSYGRLSGNTPDQIRSGEGGRVDESTQSLKRHPADFMLWKPDSSHLMKWPSPWGEGYPGWHLECSVMAHALLGMETNGVIDVHSGGEDNIFPHHDCEIAQTCGATGESQFARYWFHTRFLQVEGEKMSKSKGNFYTLGDLVEKGASPAAVRLELIRMHYRDNANFTFQGLKDAQRLIDKWKRLESWLESHAAVAREHAGPGPLMTALEAFTGCVASDLNLSGAIGALQKGANHYSVGSEPPAGDAAHGTLADELAALRAMNSVLGVLDLETNVDQQAGVDVAWVDERVAARDAAKASKDWATADAIRDELTAAGIALKDGPDGTTWSRTLE